MDVFLHDLDQTYTTGQLTTDDGTALRYLDYAVIEQQMPMIAANMFWLDALHDCKIDYSLPLPYDRYRLSDEHRTGRGTSVSFDFGEDLSRAFLTCASSNNITLEYLALSCYYVFLFKLTNGERDLCIGINTNGRYRDELRSPIGMFVNTIPLRCQLDPHWSFYQLIEHGEEITKSSLKYSYFPLQRILAQHPNVSKPAFLDTSFEFRSNESDNKKNDVMIGDARLCIMPFSIKISEDEIMSKFDFVLIMQHDLNIDQLSCTINVSLDLFDAKTVNKIAQRYHSILEQLLIVADDEVKKPIYKYSLTLPNERLLMRSLNNTQVSFPSVTCIHHEFVFQVMNYPQKLCVELDDQSLTYSELLYYVQILSLNLLSKQGIVPGEIICQCVERSLSMVIGIMAIEMVGDVYCPLSSQDPQYRLHALLQQTQSRLVLGHWLTKTKFNDDVVSLDIDSVLINNDVESDVDVERLTNIIVTPDDIAYIIFTSGSTGTPKAVQIRHRNFTDCLCSLIHIGIFKQKNNVVQIANCSFDAHVQEIVGALLFSSTVIMLHPHGNADFVYLTQTLHNKQITYMLAVPSFLYHLYYFIHKNNIAHPVTVQTICCVGELLSYTLVKLLLLHTVEGCRIWNSYGPAETTLGATYHLVDVFCDNDSVPIGRPFPNYQCLVLDELCQRVVVNQEGELLVGGVGVFAGYLGRDDLTEKMLLKIDGKLYYRTGDLVQIDNNSLLHYRGRKDYQIKLHGQRIELEEIERCLLNTSISACVVIKWGDDRLVAYVEGSGIGEKELREHCQSHLPPHMIPSIFIVLEHLSLNTNGKVDRKLLPTPQSSAVANTDHTDSLLLTPLEEHLRRIFSEAFHTESPDINMSFVQMGGTSLDAIRALWLIQQEIYSKTDAGLLFANPSISQLAQAIEPLLVVQDNLCVIPSILRSEED